MTRLAMLVLVAACSSKPSDYRWSVSDPHPDALDYCVRARTAGGDELELCTSSLKACAQAAKLARNRGQSWLIRDKSMRLERVSLCFRRGMTITEQKVDI